LKRAPLKIAVNISGKGRSPKKGGNANTFTR